MGESWAHDSAAPEHTRADTVPAAPLPQGLAGYVVQLQGLVGNSAVSRVLGHASARQLQRKVAIYPDDLGGGGIVGKRRYHLIKKTLAAYHAARDPAHEAMHLTVIQGLIKAWKAEVLPSPHLATLQRLRQILLLE